MCNQNCTERLRNRIREEFKGLIWATVDQWLFILISRVLIIFKYLFFKVCWGGASNSCQPIKLHEKNFPTSTNCCEGINHNNNDNGWSNINKMSFEPNMYEFIFGDIHIHTHPCVFSLQLQTNNRTNWSL